MAPILTPHFDLNFNHEPRASFWAATSRAQRRRGSGDYLGGAADLYELFVHNLSLLVAGAGQADLLAHAFFSELASDQLQLRQLVLGLAQSARSYLPDMAHALVVDGLGLSYARDVVIGVLLAPINPARRKPRFVESAGVIGARTVSAFTHTALHFETEVGHATEDARLLGFDSLFQTLTRWKKIWSDFLKDLRRGGPAFRAQAYAANLYTQPLWQTA